MVKILIKLAGLEVVVALALASAVVWALGGPTEARAILRLDGAHAVPLTPLGLGTCYAPGYAQRVPGDPVGGFDGHRSRRIGKPLQIVWADRSGPRRVWFELKGERLVVSGTDGVDLAPGASMESVDPARRGLREVEWRYSWQCTYIDSNRSETCTLTRDA